MSVNLFGVGWKVKILSNALSPMLSVNMEGVVTNILDEKKFDAKFMINGKELSLRIYRPETGEDKCIEFIKPDNIHHTSSDF